MTQHKGYIKRNIEQVETIVPNFHVQYGKQWPHVASENCDVPSA